MDYTYVDEIAKTLMNQRATGRAPTMQSQKPQKQKEDQSRIPPFQSSSILLFLVGERTSLSLWQLYHILQALRRGGIEANQEV